MQAQAIRATLKPIHATNEKSEQQSMQAEIAILTENVAQKLRNPTATAEKADQQSHG